MTARYQLRPVGVHDAVLGRVIHRADAEWNAYREWLAAGNAPDPMPVVPPAPPSPAELAAREELRKRKDIRAELASDLGVAALRAMTPQQVDAWVAGVQGMADARKVLQSLARVVALLAREQLGPPTP